MQPKAISRIAFALPDGIENLETWMNNLCVSAQLSNKSAILLLGV